MVLYTVSDRTLYSVVVGFDLEKEMYFNLDPNNKGIIFEDLLSSNIITEYILFDYTNE